MLRVKAPSNLPGNFQLEVKDKFDQSFKVSVPEGGVSSGEIFVVPIPDGYQMHEELLDIPKGRWSDGLCHFCSYGPCHPSLCCAIFFGPVLMGQVMERMRLTWCGNFNRSKYSMGAFKTVLILFISYVVFDTCLSAYMDANTRLNYNENGQVNVVVMYDPMILVVKWIAAIAFGLWAMCSLKNTRRNVRRQFNIPEERCAGCEDLCCAAFCSCCTVSQLARHTGNYDKLEGNCCTDTGLPPYAAMAAPHTV